MHLVKSTVSTDTFLRCGCDIIYGAFLISCEKKMIDIIGTLIESRNAVGAGKTHPEVAYKVLKTDKEQRKQAVSTDIGNLMAEFKDKR